MTHQTIPGHMAYRTHVYEWGPVYQWGPDEQERAARQAARTGDNPHRPRDENPHRREAVYSTADFERVRTFNEWAKAHPDADHADNPFVHPAVTRERSDLRRKQKKVSAVAAAIAEIKAFISATADADDDAGESARYRPRA